MNAECLKMMNWIKIHGDAEGISKGSGHVQGDRYTEITLVLPMADCILRLECLTAINAKTLVTARLL